LAVAVPSACRGWTAHRNRGSEWTMYRWVDTHRTSGLRATSVSESMTFHRNLSVKARDWTQQISSSYQVRKTKAVCLHRLALGRPLAWASVPCSAISSISQRSRLRGLLTRNRLRAAVPGVVHQGRFNSRQISQPMPGPCKPPQWG